MIKKGCLILVLLCLLGLWGCSKKESTEPVGTTLMVYMIGSDLEAKAGAATEDLAEMAASGIDLTRHKVVVCAGGSDYWHNDAPQTDDRRILELTENGFVQIEQLPSQSMGEADSLQAFLDYAVSAYPSQRYALILWDHGNGPLEGYGKDMLFGNDALLLEEMGQAMDASAFGPDNKLAFVGFDACLMASAELNCLWADYADYLVASQEVEPAFGWNYSFLQDLGNPDVPALLTRLTSDYLNACLAYYQEKGYENRDTTLSCVDLSKAPALEKALGDLFTKAAQEDQYNALVACRVQTRALGRSTTGSEYDLVDLADLALQLKPLYPQEAAALEAAVADMVIANATNTTGCSGMSLYFPFYNKQYYQRRWQETYRKLEPFPAYQEYLALYEKSWLDTGLVSSFSASFAPTTQNGQYTLTMTPEQADNYASARYYILRREAEQQYTCVYVSSNITRTDNVLTANFEGNVIYISNLFGTSFIPVSAERERIGDLAHYYIPFSLVGFTSDPDDIYGPITDARYDLVLNAKTGEISVSSLLPSESSVDTDTLMGGKLEELTLLDYERAVFSEVGHKYLTRDENGLVLPFDQWDQNSWLTGYELYCVDGLDFVYAPLAGGEYFLMMEVRDTRGNLFSSELLPIQVSQKETAEEPIPQEQISWDSGEQVLLWSDENMEVSLVAVEVTGKINYVLELRNHSDRNLKLQAYNLLCNDNIRCIEGSGFGTTYAPSGQTGWSSLVDLGIGEMAGDLTQLENLHMIIMVRDADAPEILLPYTQFKIDLSAERSAFFTARQNRIAYNSLPLCGARAETQVLIDNEELTVTLLGLGYSEEAAELFSTAPNYILRAENKTSQDLSLAVSGMAINHVYIDSGPKILFPANQVSYLSGTISSYQLEDIGMEQIQSLDLLLSVIANDSIAGGFHNSVWCPVTLAESGVQEEPFQECETVIFDKEGVRIALDLSKYRYDFQTEPTFYMTVYNSSEQSIIPMIRNVTVNGVPASSAQLSRSIYLYGGACGPNQYGTGYLWGASDGQSTQKLCFTIQLLNIHEEYITYTDTQTITLYINLETKEARYEKN